MSAMVRELMTGSALLVLPLLAMAIFASVFTLAVVLAWRKDTSEISQLPLKGDES